MRSTRLKWWGWTLFGLLLWAVSAFGAEPKDILLTDTEKAWLAEHPVLTVAPDPDFPPIEWINENGNFVGLAADFARLVEQKLGIRFKVLQLESWDEVLARAKSRQVDILTAASPSQQRREYLLFTRPHIVLPGVIFVRKDVSGELTVGDLRGKKVTVVSGYVWQDYLSQELPGLPLVPAKNVSHALEMVSFGEVDAMVGDLATATYYLQKMGLSNLRVAGETGHFTYLSMASRNDWPVLNHILEKALASIDPKQSKAIVDQWIGTSREAPLIPHETMVAVGLGLGAIGLLLAGTVIWNRSLRKLADKKTRELSLELAERERAEAALLESEEKFRSISSYALDGIIMIDPSGNISFWNNAAERIFGYSSSEIVGRELHALLTPVKYKDDYLRGLAHFRSSGDGFVLGKTLELTAIRKDGTEFPIELSVAPLRLGGQWHAVGIVRDITSRKLAEQEKAELHIKLQQAQKMQAIGTLAGGIAHDFNNILSAIIGYAELAILKNPESQNTRDCADNILKASGRARDLVRQILTFARQSEQEKKPVQVSLVVKEALKLLRATLPTTIEIRESVEANALINGDPTQVHQILINLCTNARLAMPNGGILEVTLSEVELDANFTARYPEAAPMSYLRLTVTDTGEGMKPEVQARIFDPFFTTREKNVGTGMGLSVVHGIVTDYGGFITVYSEPGQGSTFNIFLPVSHDMAEEVPRIPEIPPGGTEHILFVDDEETIVSIMTSMLEMLGYQVTGVVGSQSALERFLESPEWFDLVITDMTMPNLTGVELAREIKNVRPDLPIILCTGFSESVTSERSKYLGFSAFLLKPLILRDLALTIRAVLDNEKPSPSG